MTAAAPSHDPRPDPTGTGVIEVELAQSLGLFEAVTIGIGTMIGAGIFVLPGFIVQKTGPAAVAAFALGGVVALLNALAAAEVATGMPRSGGGYYFISRALGPLWGAIIGWGSWFGLVFATAFYAVGFGEYVHAWVGLPVTTLAIGMTVLLVLLNLVGSKAAGSAQNLIVAVLIAVIVLFVGRGAAEADFALPFSQEGGFSPFGVGAVVAGTATLFVTYCGFGEIASMAEEIKDPGRNLPRALVGSVVAVTALYCVVIYLCVALRPWEDLEGPTVVADLAGDMLGGWGRGAILVGAVMATVSSANASIMSASRICFAMGRDDMIWPWLNVVHPRFRVPHRAIWVTGALILAVLFVGEIELLAEAAGLLHLLMYGLMSLACVVLRGARPLHYRPAFRVPLFPWVPLAGALGTAVVALFIAPLVLAMGLGLVAFAVLHYVAWSKRRTAVRGAWPWYVRRSLLEPALRRVEALGAEPAEPTTLVVAVRNPHAEQARLHVASALLDDLNGRILALNVFQVKTGDTLADDVLDSYHRTLADRQAALREQTARIVPDDIKVTSLVPMAVAVAPATLSTCEVSHASLLFLGWPAPHAQEQGRYPLLVELARHANAPLLALREDGSVPAADVAVLLRDDRSGRLALGLAARLAAAWDVPLGVWTRVAEDATDGDVIEAEAAVEERVFEVTRARVRAVRAASDLDAVRTVAAAQTFVVVPGRDDDPDLMGVLRDLDGVHGASVLFVQARADHDLEPWVTP